MRAQQAVTDEDVEFIAKLRRLSENWRYSSEFIGAVVRHRWPKNYSDLDASRADDS